MPIFCFDVNCADDEKLVPITRQNGASIGPDTLAIALDLVEMGTENGPLQVLGESDNMSGVGLLFYS
jgi:hypothetical protein